MSLRKFLVYTFDQMDLIFTSLNILSANEVSTKVHDLRDRSVGNDANHPKVVVQSRSISWVPIVIQDCGARVRDLVCQKEVR